MLLPLTSAEVIVVSVTDPEARIGANENASEDLARAEAILRGAGVASRGVTRRGDFAEEIVAVAREEHADLIVMGSTAHGAFVQWVTGGVSTEVIRRWRGAVMVVGPE